MLGPYDDFEREQTLPRDPQNKKLSCRKEAARAFVSLKSLLAFYNNYGPILYHF